MGDFAEQRRRLVAALARQVADPAVLAAIADVPRERFVEPGRERHAYRDTALPIRGGQTISQPRVVAEMAAAAALTPAARVLEVGAGSGYAAAILSRIAATVVAIERDPDLAALARERLAMLGYDNVAVQVGDGSLGWPADAPYDAILVAAAAPQMPDALRDQLAVGGRLVIPVGARGFQRLLVVRRRETTFETKDLGAVAFVPLIGAQGWHD